MPFYILSLAGELGFKVKKVDDSQVSCSPQHLDA